MKNIYILPTTDWKHKRHLYVTSVEEFIEEGDYGIDLDDNSLFKCKSKYGEEFTSELLKNGNLRGLSDYDNCKKIILTTDPTLIRYGVQKIPIVFLEWFVKNPSCEFVEVERKHPVMIGTPNRLEGNYDYRCYKCGVIVNMIGSKCDTICNKCLVYKIAIPQESNLEKISSTELSHDFQQFINDNWDYLIGDEEPKQEWKPKEGEKVWIHVFSNWSSGKYIGYDVDKNVHLVREPEEGGGNLFASPDILPYSALPNEPKQETLKEAAENYAKGWGENDDVKSFIAGVKWQAERMYSEEEVDLFIYKLIGKFTDWSGSYVYKDKLIEIYEKLKKK